MIDTAIIVHYTSSSHEQTLSIKNYHDIKTFITCVRDNDKLGFTYVSFPQTSVEISLAKF